MNTREEINIFEKYGKRIFDQKIGTEVGKIILNSKTKSILNFDNVDSINTAFWNALISELIKNDDKKKPSDFFSMKNANETIKNTLIISLQLLEFYENK